jgi:hypothetical protein
VSAYSVCNMVASDPPIVADRAGNSYGRLTLNRATPGALVDSRIQAWLATVCARP